MVNRKYNRIFILLNGKNEGVGINLNGSCDIEIINGKARLYAYIGGMGRLKNKERYLYLFSTNETGSTAVKIGKFEMKGSNAVIETSLDPDSIDNSGVQVEKISGAAVWGENDEPAKAVLEGFVSRQVNWLKNLNIYGKSGIYNPKDKKIVSDEPQKEENNLQAAEAIPMYASYGNPRDTPHDTFRAIAEKFRRELDMLDEIGIIDKNAILNAAEESKENAEKKKESTQEDIEEIKEEHREASGKKLSDKLYIDVLFAGNERLAIDKRAEWIKADYREIYFLPQAVKCARSLFVKSCARKGRHIIIGRSNDNYYVGVPGSKRQNNSAELNGFDEFVALNNTDDFGYWIKRVI